MLSSHANLTQGDNPDFRTLLETRGAVAAALGKVCFESFIQILILILILS